MLLQQEVADAAYSSAQIASVMVNQHPQTAVITNTAVEELLELFEVLTQISFDSIKSGFGQRRLYVLFEPALRCDPETDHKVPKNVYPLFQRQIEQARHTLLDVNRLNIRYQFEKAVGEAVYNEVQRRYQAEEKFASLLGEMERLRKNQRLSEATISALLQQLEKARAQTHRLYQTARETIEAKRKGAVAFQADQFREDKLQQEDIKYDDYVAGTQFDGVIKGLRAQIQELELKLREKEERIEDLQTLASGVPAHLQMIDKLKRDLANGNALQKEMRRLGDENSARLQKVIQQLEAEKITLFNTVEQQRDLLAEKTGALQDRGQEIAKLQAQIGDLDTELQRYKALVKQKSREISELKLSQAEYQQYREETQAVETSVIQMPDAGPMNVNLVHGELLALVTGMQLKCYPKNNSFKLFPLQKIQTQYAQTLQKMGYSPELLQKTRYLFQNAPTFTDTATQYRLASGESTSVYHEEDHFEVHQAQLNEHSVPEERHHEPPSTAQPASDLGEQPSPLKHHPGAVESALEDVVELKSTESAQTSATASVAPVVPRKEHAAPKGASRVLEPQRLSPRPENQIGTQSDAALSLKCLEDAKIDSEIETEREADWKVPVSPQGPDKFLARTFETQRPVKNVPRTKTIAAPTRNQHTHVGDDQDTTPAAPELGEPAEPFEDTADAEYEKIEYSAPVEVLVGGVQQQPQRPQKHREKNRTENVQQPQSTVRENFEGPPIESTSAEKSSTQEELFEHPEVQNFPEALSEPKAKPTPQPREKKNHHVEGKALMPSPIHAQPDPHGEKRAFKEQAQVFAEDLDPAVSYQAEQETSHTVSNVPRERQPLQPERKTPNVQKLPVLATKAQPLRQLAKIQVQDELSTAVPKRTSHEHPANVPSTKESDSAAAAAPKAHAALSPGQKEQNTALRSDTVQRLRQSQLPASQKPWAQPKPPSAASVHQSQKKPKNVQEAPQDETTQLLQEKDDAGISYGAVVRQLDQALDLVSVAKDAALRTLDAADFGAQAPQDLLVMGQLGKTSVNPTSAYRPGLLRNNSVASPDRRAQLMAYRLDDSGDETDEDYMERIMVRERTEIRVGEQRHRAARAAHAANDLLRLSGATVAGIMKDEVEVPAVFKRLYDLAVEIQRKKDMARELYIMESQQLNQRILEALRRSSSAAPRPSSMMRVGVLNNTGQSIKQLYEMIGCSRPAPCRAMSSRPLSQKLATMRRATEQTQYAYQTTHIDGLGDAELMEAIFDVGAFK